MTNSAREPAIDGAGAEGIARAACPIIARECGRADAGHFLQEDKPAELAALINDMIAPRNGGAA